jgi:hypothetical protein
LLADKGIIQIDLVRGDTEDRGLERDGYPRSASWGKAELDMFKPTAGFGSFLANAGFASSSYERTVRMFGPPLPGRVVFIPFWFLALVVTFSAVVLQWVFVLSRRWANNQATPVNRLPPGKSKGPTQRQDRPEIPRTGFFDGGSAKSAPLLCVLLVIIIGSGLLATGSAQILVPKFTASANSLLPTSMQQETHLVDSLLAEPNKSFDEAVYRAVRADVRPPAIISFHLVTFVFSYQTTNDYAGSFCEMGAADELICTGKSVSRRSSSTNEIPVNYVRIVDRQKREVTADLDLLVGVAPLKDPNDVHYLRRSFHFVYRDGWKEELDHNPPVKK